MTAHLTYSHAQQKRPFEFTYTKCTHIHTYRQTYIHTWLAHLTWSPPTKTTICMSGFSFIRAYARLLMASSQRILCMYMHIYMYVCICINCKYICQIAHGFVPEDPVYVYVCICMYVYVLTVNTYARLLVASSQRILCMYMYAYICMYMY